VAARTATAIAVVTERSRKGTDDWLPPWAVVRHVGQLSGRGSAQRDHGAQHVDVVVTTSAGRHELDMP